MFRSTKMEITLAGEDEEFLNQLRTLALPPNVQKKIDNPESGWTIEEGIVHDKERRRWVPDTDSLRMDLIKNFHDPPHVGHPGMRKTQDLILRGYFWNGIRKDITKYIRSCSTCQQMKVFLAKSSGLLNPIPPASSPWEEITADLIVQLPDSRGYQAIFVIVNRFTKQAHFIPMTNDISTEGATRLYRDYVWKDHGWPKKIITDQGTQFSAKFMGALNKMLGTQGALSTAYHPQTDGQTERTNQELKQYLRLYTNFMQDNWSEWLSQAEFAYNN
jgi:hypothetical protein